MYQVGQQVFVVDARKGRLYGMRGSVTAVSRGRGTVRVEFDDHDAVTLSFHQVTAAEELGGAAGRHRTTDPLDSARQVADALSRLYLDAAAFSINEVSGDMTSDRIALLAKVNGLRASAGLSPLDPPEHWPCLECEGHFGHHADGCDVAAEDLAASDPG